MFGQKKKTEPFFNTMFPDVKLDVKPGSELEKQIAMIGMTTEDLQMIRALQPFVNEEIGNIVDQFYKNLEHESSLLHIINSNSSIERLKKTLTRHIIQMFSGEIDASYIEQRLIIAHVHVRIGLKTKWYMSAFQDILLSIISIVEKNVPNKEEVIPAIRAVSKILNLEQQLVLEAYDQESDRIKAELEDQKNSIRLNVANTSENLAAISEETNASFEDLVNHTDEIMSFAKQGTVLSEETKDRAMQGKSEMSNLATNMEYISSAVDRMILDADTLLEIMKQMEDIINIVTGIAEQTNLLSLNASIEAARAGDSGRGFAVVAEEVRKLSDETKHSVVNVSDLIKNTNEQVAKLTLALDKIRTDVKNGNNHSHETENHFEMIVTTMNETNQQNNKIESELQAFVQNVNAIGKAFEEVAVSADGLTAMTQELK